MKKLYLKKIKYWLNQERVGRPEAGTSQDMAPTNGDLLFMYIWYSIPCILIALYFIFGIYKLESGYCG